jgi:polysaccharide biosynthesis/export protein
MKIMLFSRLLTVGLLISCDLARGSDGPSQFADRNPRYKLQPNDVVEVQYRYTPEYNQVASVQPDGFVTLPLLGDVQLGGLNLIQARQEIFTLASIRLKDPEVSLILREFDRPKFTVTGEVQSSGRFELRGNTSVLDAIAIAGGFKTASAGRSQVLLIRRVNGIYSQTKILDVKQLIKRQTFAEDEQLRAGDILIVPQNTISKVERYMKWANLGVYASPALR